MAFFVGSVNGIRVLDLQTRGETVPPSWMGVVGTWSPAGSQMLLNNLSAAADKPCAREFVADYATQTVSPALGNATVQAEFSVPA